MSTVSTASWERMLDVPRPLPEPDRTIPHRCGAVVLDIPTGRPPRLAIAAATGPTRSRRAVPTPVFERGRSSRIGIPPGIAAETRRNNHPGRSLRRRFRPRVSGVNFRIEVGRVLVPLDDDPAANQAIAYGASGGTPFDFAMFGLFVNGNEPLMPANAIEVVDNVEFELVTAVPEPSSLTPFGLGLLPAAVVATRRWGRR